MKTRLAVLCMMAGLWLAPGCTGITYYTPSVTTSTAVHRLAEAWATRNTVMSALAVLRANGAFTTSQAAEITKMRDSVDMALAQWELALRGGNLIDQTSKELAANQALTDFKARRLAAEKVGVPTPTTKPK